VRGRVKREYYTIAAAAFQPRQVGRRRRGRFMVLDYTSRIYIAHRPSLSKSPVRAMHPGNLLPPSPPPTTYPPTRIRRAPVRQLF